MSNRLIQTISLKDDGYSRNVKSAREALEKLGKENGVVNNSFRSTSKELNAAKKFYGQLTSEYSKLSDSAKKGEFGKAMHAQIEQTRKDLKQLMEDTARTKKELADMESQAKEKMSGGFSFKQMGSDVMGKLGLGSLTKIGAGPMALTAMLAGVGEEYVRSTKLAMDYESALSNLKAITGVAGKDFDTFKEKIEATGFATSKSFEEVTDAYTKVGSAMPELLKTPNALDAVTRAAITLSKASRMDLDSAINSLTGIMNQFGANASQANTYINALAAGAKEGSAGIQYLATAMDKCGTSLATTNLGIEQGTALIEVLAKKIPDASTAGTNLRNILLKMSQAQDKFNPKVVGMEQALKNLQPKIKDTAFMVKMFGAENVNAAITLAQNVDKYTELTQKVSGTNEAFIQAKTQTDNLASAMTKLSTNWDNFIVSINKSTGPLSWATNKLADFVKWLEKHWNISHKGGYATLGFGDDSGWKDKETPEEQRDAFYEQRGKLDERIKKIKDAQALVRKRLNEDYSESIKNAFRASLRGYDKELKQLYGERNRISREYANTVWNGTQTSTPTDTGSTNSNTSTSKTKSPKQIYDETMNVIEAELSNGIITVKKALEKKKTAIEQYISALSKTEAQIKKNTPLIKKLSADFKTIDAELKVIEQREKDEKTVSDASEKYAKTIKQIERDRQNGFIDEKEYQTSYISAIKELIKSYSKVENLTDDLINTVKEKQKEIKAFELQKQFNEVQKMNISNQSEVERIYNNGEVERQAPANDNYKAHETAYKLMTFLADSIDYDEILNNKDYKQTPHDEQWLKNYKAQINEYANILDNMFEDINTLEDAARHAKKLQLAHEIEYNYDYENMNRRDLVDQFYDEMQLIDVPITFDKEKFLNELAELCEQEKFEIDVEPTAKGIEDAIYKLYGMNLGGSPIHQFLIDTMHEIDDSVNEILNFANNWHFPKRQVTKGDASNYSMIGNKSYFEVSKAANKYNYGAGRLDENLMDDRITKQMNDDMDALLAKYKDIEELYVKQNAEADKNGFDSLRVDYSQELDALEKQINSLHNKIQDRLTFQLKMEGAQDALGGLNNFASIGSSLASIPDTLDSIADSSNDAAAAFQYFGVIINSVQDIIDGIKVTMEIYKALQDLFTVSTQAQNLAIQDNAASQVQQAATSEANTLAKTTETVANKALEASVLDLAAAEIFAAHAYIPFAGVPIATANVGAMMGSMAGVHATSLGLTAMANGGIVGGMQFSGDATLIRANKGEMVLNKEQQANLFSLLDSPSARGGVKGDVRFEIQGDKLVGVLNNHNRYHSKSGNKLKL